MASGERTAREGLKQSLLQSAMVQSLRNDLSHIETLHMKNEESPSPDLSREIDDGELDVLCKGIHSEAFEKVLQWYRANRSKVEDGVDTEVLDAMIRRQEIRHAVSVLIEKTDDVIYSGFMRDRAWGAPDYELRAGEYQQLSTEARQAISAAPPEVRKRLAQVVEYRKRKVIENSNRELGLLDQASTFIINACDSG